MRDDNSEWKQMQEEEQQWLADPVAQKEYQDWLDNYARTGDQVQRCIPVDANSKRS